MSNGKPNHEAPLPILRPKHRAFVEHYLQTWNAAEAARRAGYRTKSNVQGARMLANASIRSAIQTRLDEAAMSADEVLARLAQQARGTLDDFIDERGGIDLAKARERGQIELLKKYSVEEVCEAGQGDQAPSVVRRHKFELEDRQTALITLGKHHKLWTDRVENTGKDGGPVEIAVREVVVHLTHVDESE